MKLSHLITKLFKNERSGEKYEVERLLGNQKIITGNTTNELTSAISRVAQILNCKEGEVIVQQDELSNDIYFILCGEVTIEINRRKKAVRRYGDHVGEMAVVNPGAPRSATMIAGKNTILAKLDEKTFSKIANQYPQLWKNIAQTLAARLRERNLHERIKNEIPKIFIASSRENIEDLKQIKQYLDETSNFSVESWTDENMFKPSTYTLDTLEDQAKSSDFAIILFEFDDQLIS
jgi:CRP-like cAMP-binding protein